MSNETIQPEVLFVLIPEFADWEYAILAPGLRGGGLWEGKYAVKTVAPTLNPALSMGGFHILPDYSFDTMPENYAALVLVGGLGWRGEEAARVVPIVRQALEKNIVLGAICDASMFLAANGFLNNVEHTSNGLNYLKKSAGAAYTGETLYRKQPSVRAGNLVTACGAGHLDFACNMLAALDAAPAEGIASLREMLAAGMYPDMPA